MTTERTYGQPFRLRLTYIDCDAQPVFTRYQNGQPAIQLVATDSERNRALDMGPGDPIATASVAMPEPPPPGSVWIKDWSENEGMAEALIAAGIIAPEPTAQLASGFVTACAYRLNPGALSPTTQEPTTMATDSNAITHDPLDRFPAEIRDQVNTILEDSKNFQWIVVAYNALDEDGAKQRCHMAMGDDLIPEPKGNYGLVQSLDLSQLASWDPNQHTHRAWGSMPQGLELALGDGLKQYRVAAYMFALAQPHQRLIIPKGEGLPPCPTEDERLRALEPVA